jgi:ABC-type branched-subunit amino acid transport system ATPase component
VVREPAVIEAYPGRRRARDVGVDDALATLHREGLTLLLAEQSVPMALEIADYACVLQTGRTVLEGEAKTLEHDPKVQRIYLGTAGGSATPA